MKPDPVLLDDFIRRFFGYGSWDADLWFVGMEEGGGSSIDELIRRLNAWDRTDELADLVAYHRKIHVDGKDWFKERPPIQSTWGKLARVALAAAERPTDAESVRQYQRDELGRRGGKTALIELLPLPARSTRQWPYGNVGNPLLASREGYRNAFLSIRISAIRERIVCHRPSAVVFYGMGYRQHWESIAQLAFSPVEGERFLLAKSDRIYILATHPATKGVRNADFVTIGRFLASNVS